MKRIMLTLKSDHLSVRYGDRLGKDEITRQVTTIEELEEFISEHPALVICSSTLDFPDEYTNDPKLIALCRAIRD